MNIHRLTLLFIVVVLSFQPFLAQRNVLIIIADDLSPDYLGCFSTTTDTAVTPSIRALAERGVRFSNLWSTPLCSPTRSEIFTGRYPFRTGIGTVILNAQTKQLDTSEMSIAKLLKFYSPITYATANVGKWNLHLPNPPAQRSFPNRMGYDLYSGSFAGMLPSFYSYTRIRNGVLDTVNTYATTQTVNETIEWISSVKQGTPFFCWLAFNAPHVPFHVPPASLCNTTGLSTDTNAIRRNPVPYFKAAVQAMDTEIGRLLAFLRERSILDSTDVIFIGDNGNASQVAQSIDPQKAKATCYDYGVHVPMIVAGPSVRNPKRMVSSVVNAVDLFATMLEMCGFTSWRDFIPRNTMIDAVSLLPIIRDEASSVRSWAFSEQFTKPAIPADGKTIRNQRYQLLRFDAGGEEFYDLIADPLENTNLLLGSLTPAQSENYQVLCQQLLSLTGIGTCQTVSVTLSERQPDVRVTPNPAFTHLQFRVNGAIDLITITDAAGQQRYFRPVDVLPISDLSAGVYNVRVQYNGSKVSHHTVVIER